MIQSVKLSKLRLSASNVRTAPDEALRIEPFAADLEARGVLQNLLVTPVSRPRGMFEVFDGGRRWHALSRTDDGGGTRGMRVIDSAFVGNRVWYAAAEILQNSEALYVIALVCIVRWNPNAKDGYIFAHKDQEESMGPCDAGCPARILRLLSPTDKEYALDWRRRCLVRLRFHARRIEDGMRIRLPAAMTFSDGHSGTEFVVVKQGEKLRFRTDGRHGRYCISHFRERAWSVVAEPKVHRTVFAPAAASATAA